MKRNNEKLALIVLTIIMMLQVSCMKKESAFPSNEIKTTSDHIVAEDKQPGLVQLPVRFNNPGYFAHDEETKDILGEETDRYTPKIGADISSTEVQPLWIILKKLASRWGKSISWQSDVDPESKVDVDIRSNNTFEEAITNILRQLDYTYEIQKDTIIVKYRETKHFNIPMPTMASKFTSTVGGNFLTDREAATGTDGIVKITSADNEYDFWATLENNLSNIMIQWGTFQAESESSSTKDKTKPETAALVTTKDQFDKTSALVVTDPAGKQDKSYKATVKESAKSPFFTIDKTLGIISVTAPPSIIEKVENYLNQVVKEMYRQVVIEAKIIEVFLKDNSKIGIDWSAVLKNFEIKGEVEFGTGGVLGQVWPWNPPDERKSDSPYPSEYPNSFVYTVGLNRLPFTAMLNALNEQGDVTVLSNPKLTVLNGQPALLSVGKDVAYIKEVTSDVDGNTGTITYTTETDSVVEGIAFGVTASIIDNDSVVMHLTPITTDLVNDVIEYREFGSGQSVGLPQVQIREMSTMVQVKNGEMLIIGGLIDSIEAKDGKFAPVVGNIPLVKYLFGVEEKRMEKRELVILLTPKII